MGFMVRVVSVDLGFSVGVAIRLSNGDLDKDPGAVTI